MRICAAIVCSSLIICTGFAKNKKDIPPAPLPTAVVNAHKIFITNGGGSELAYDSFYSAMKDWGKYEVVGSPEEADLVVEVAYRVENRGTHVWSASNVSNGTTQVYSAQMIDPELTLSIYDAKTKNALWSAVDHRQLARLQKNREKETINSAQRLVDQLKARINSEP
jgi:hypothetical protein